MQIPDFFWQDHFKMAISPMMRWKPTQQKWKTKLFHIKTIISLLCISLLKWLIVTISWWNSSVPLSRVSSNYCKNDVIRSQMVLFRVVLNNIPVYQVREVNEVKLWLLVTLLSTCFHTLISLLFCVLWCGWIATHYKLFFKIVTMRTIFSSLNTSVAILRKRNF